LKFDTHVDRLVRSKIQPSLLFFRTSSISRATPRFLNESAIIPPLFYTACVHALQELALSVYDLEIHFADEEGDPYAVELAARVGAYVVGLDSDYAVLNSDGYLGYIPFDEIVWGVCLEQNLEPEELEDVGDFQLVKRLKDKKSNANGPALRRGIIPPDTTSRLTLSAEYFSPSSLASYLNIPVSLLPLLGAFVGNDFSKLSPSSDRTAHSRLFNRQLTSTQRINHVASTLRSILSSSSQKRKQKQVGSVMDLIDRTVAALLNRSIFSMGSGEVKEIVDKVVEATLPYAIPKFDAQDESLATEICLLHTPEVCPILPFFSRRIADALSLAGEENEEVVQRDMVRRLYLTAYREGELAPQIMDVLSTGTYWPNFFLENPDLETVSICMGRHIRQWSYSILEGAVGLPDPEDKQKMQEEDRNRHEGDDDDENDLIDVVEEDSEGEALTSGRGGHRGLHDPEVEVTKPQSSTPSHSPSIQPPQPKIVIEYIRRGTRAAPEEVTVPLLMELLQSIPHFDAQNISPLQLRSEADRLEVLLCAVNSNTPSIKALPSEHLAVALTLRWVLYAIHTRAKESGGSKMKEKERWTKHEAQSFLASSLDRPEAISTIEVAVPVEERNVQLMAQVLMALESIQHISQTLLLAKRVPLPIHRFSGKACHAYWTGMIPLDAQAVPPSLWDACTGELEEGTFAEPKQRITKKGKKNVEVSAPAPSKRVSNAGRHGGLYGLLDSAEA
jgi:hypothetical protein